MLTCVIPLRYNEKRKYLGNNDIFEALDRSINSFLYQNVITEIIIVNNTPSYLCDNDEQLKYIIKKYNDKIKILNLNNINVLFNRSWLLNVGLRQMTNEYFLACDIDIILEPNFSNKFNSVQKYLKNNTVYSCSSFGYIENNINWKNFSYPDQYDKYKKKLSKRNGNGILICKKNILIEINGYNEKFQVWGYEDEDLINRLKKYKDIKFDLGYFHCLHQPHMTAGPAILNDKEIKAKIKNNEIYSSKNKHNNKNWGSLSGPIIKG